MVNERHSRLVVVVYVAAAADFFGHVVSEPKSNDVPASMLTGSLWLRIIVETYSNVINVCIQIYNG